MLLRGHVYMLYILKAKSLDVMFGVSISISSHLFLKDFRALQVDLAECKRECCLLNFVSQVSQKHQLCTKENPVTFALLLTKASLWTVYTLLAVYTYALCAEQNL